MASKLETLKFFLEQKVQHAARNLEKFKESLEKDPVHAFTWADATMATTAYGRVAEIFLNNIKQFEEKNASLEGEERTKAEVAAVEHIRSFALKQALTKGRFSSQSTSVGSNKMEREELAAYADLVSEMEFF